MSDTDIDAVAEAVRSATKAQGRTYTNRGLTAQWLAKEAAEHCKTQGWASRLHRVGSNDQWLVVTNDIAALVGRDGQGVTVKATDLNPVMLKTGLVLMGLLALTGAGIVALPMAGAGAWRARSRKAKLNSIIAFIDARVLSLGLTASAGNSSGSVAERLRNLAALRDQGLISDTELAAKRLKLIDKF